MSHILIILTNTSIICQFVCEKKETCPLCVPVSAPEDAEDIVRSVDGRLWKSMCSSKISPGWCGGVLLIKSLTTTGLECISLNYFEKMRVALRVQAAQKWSSNDYMEGECAPCSICLQALKQRRWMRCCERQTKVNGVNAKFRAAQTVMSASWRNSMNCKMSLTIPASVFWHDVMSVCGAPLDVSHPLKLFVVFKKKKILCRIMHYTRPDHIYVSRKNFFLVCISNISTDSESTVTL